MCANWCLNLILCVCRKLSSNMLWFYRPVGPVTSRNLLAPRASGFRSLMSCPDKPRPTAWMSTSQHTDRHIPRAQTNSMDEHPTTHSHTPRAQANSMDEHPTTHRQSHTTSPGQQHGWAPHSTQSHTTSPGQQHGWAPLNTHSHTPRAQANSMDEHPTAHSHTPRAQANSMDEHPTTHIPSHTTSPGEQHGWAPHNTHTVTHHEPRPTAWMSTPQHTDRQTPRAQANSMDEHPTTHRPSHTTSPGQQHGWAPHNTHTVTHHKPRPTAWMSTPQHTDRHTPQAQANSMDEHPTTHTQSHTTSPGQQHGRAPHNTQTVTHHEPRPTAWMSTPQHTDSHTPWAQANSMDEHPTTHTQSHTTSPGQQHGLAPHNTHTVTHHEPRPIAWMSTSQHTDSHTPRAQANSMDEHPTTHRQSHTTSPGQQHGWAPHNTQTVTHHKPRPTAWMSTPQHTDRHTPRAQTNSMDEHPTTHRLSHTTSPGQQHGWAPHNTQTVTHHEPRPTAWMSILYYSQQLFKWLKN